MKLTGTKSLYITLAIVSIFLMAIVFISTPSENQVAQTDNVFAGAPEPTDFTAPPIGGPEEFPTPAITATRSPQITVTSSPTTRASASVVASSSATPLPTLSATPIPTIAANITNSPSPVPTFDLNLPGDTTTTTTPTNAPVAQIKKSNNTPIIIGVIIGALLIVGGLILVLARRKGKDDEFIPQAGPTAPPQSYPPPATGFETIAKPTSPDQPQFNTPYDQYMNNQPQPGNPQNQ